jgi:hypothetical protein
MGKITVFTSTHCPPCQELHEAVKAGKVSEEIEIVEIDTDEGFERFKKEVLERGDGAVPSAYKEGKQCAIMVEEDGGVFFECPSDAPPASNEGAATPST